MSEYNPWVRNTRNRQKPEDGEQVIVQDRDRSYWIGYWDYEDELWIDREYNVIDVLRWCPIPKGTYNG